MGADDLARYRDARAVEELRNVWLLGGVLFICGGLTSLPSTLLLGSEAVLPAVYALTAITVALGCLCLFAARRGLSRRWLQPAITAGTACVALAAALAEPRFDFYFVSVAVFIGVAARRRSEFVFHTAVLSLAVLAPLVYDPGGAHATIRYALLAIPGLILVAFVVRHLRHGLERRERALIEFAEEAVLLIDRLPGTARAHNGDAPEISAREAAEPPSTRRGDRPARWRRRVWRPRARASR